MPTPHSNSAVERGFGAARVEGGRIINVNISSWTVDVLTLHTQRLLLDLQVGAPYLHFHSGEGVFSMPEVGALVQVCLPSDDRPFVLSFVSTFEQSQGSTQSQTEEEGETDVTFGAGRPQLQQGDLMMRCRDGNQIWLHRGGVVEIEATPVAKRVYIPITNMIRDVCENYELLHFGGELRWTTARNDTDPEGEARTLLTIATRDHAQEEKASVMVTSGHVDDELRLRCVIAPNAIDPISHEIDGEIKYDFTINADGDVTETIEGDYTRTISGDLSDTVDGDVTQHCGSITLRSDGSYSIEVSGDHEMQSSSSKERVTGSKTISCPLIRLGGDGANTPFLLATPAVIAFLAGHTHTTPAGPSGPPTPSVIAPAGQSRKVFGE